MPDPKAAEELLILGETTFRQQFRRFGMYPEDRLRHLWVLGKTGSGKSSLLANLLRQDLARGTGLALLDPHGDLVEAVLPHVPSSRSNRVLLFSPADRDWPVSFNVFRQGRRPHPDQGLLASHLVSIFRRHWADSWGPRLEHVLRNAILAVASDPRATLLFLYRFLTDEGLRGKVVGAVADPVVRQFWTREFPAYPRQLQAEAVAPALNKLGAFVAHPLVRNLVSQERSRVDLLDFMGTRSVLLADLGAGRIGEDASHLLGALLLTSTHLAAMGRPRGAPPFLVYVDEFQHFVTDSLATMLAESRKFGLGLVLAHQYLGQLSVEIRDAVLGNVGSAVLFRLGAADAQALEREFEPAFAARDLVHLPRYEAAVKLLVRGEALAPFSARTLPPPPLPADADEVVRRVRLQSRLRFARSRGEVEASVRAAFGGEQVPDPFGG